MSKKNILLDLRIDNNKFYKETREQIDISWLKKLQKNNYNPLILSSYSFNSQKELEKFCLINKIKMIILTGGGNVNSKKNYEKKRFKLSLMLIKIALKKKIKILAVCRGAQALLKFYKIKLIKEKFKIRKKISIKLIKKIKGLPNNSFVTCYHKYGVYSNDLKNSFENVYETSNKTSEVFINKERKQIGMMWHPERENKDYLFKKILNFVN